MLNTKFTDNKCDDLNVNNKKWRAFIKYLWHQIPFIVGMHVTHHSDRLLDHRDAADEDGCRVVEVVLLSAYLGAKR